MKLLRVGAKGAEKPAIVAADGRIRDVSAVINDFDGAFLASDFQARLGELDLNALPEIAADVRIGQPVAFCGKFICVGLNYADHAEESGMAIPEEPILFMKATSALNGPNDDVYLPIGAEKGDWEVELGVVIGKGGKYISEDTALDHVAGLTLINDLSERAFQIERGGQWMKGKGCDTFGPVGPWLVTVDELGDLDNLNMSLDLNGARVQTGNTKHMIFRIPYLVHYISQFMSLQPGDIISTGTPPGVGLGMKPPRFLKAGDTMSLTIDGLGTQFQTVYRDKAGA